MTIIKNMHRKSNGVKKYIAMFALTFVVLPTVVWAQAATPATTTANPCAITNGSTTPTNSTTPTAPTTPANTTTTTPSSLPRCVNQIYVWSLGISVLLAMLMIVIGGYYYMTSGGNAEQSSKGKEYITSALIGVVILFCAYLLLNEINPDLVNFNLDSINGIDPAPQQTPGATTTPTRTGPPPQTPAQPNITP